MNFQDITTQLDLDEMYDKGMTFDEFQENVERHIYETEVIYYSVAIEYLSRVDPSLRESMALAAEMGYEVSSLNSELLATLLRQQELMDDWYSIQDEVEELFNEEDEE